MSTSLLTTKLYIPPLRPNLVSRQRLHSQLDKGLQVERMLTLVCAPAGFGKTTLFAVGFLALRDWLARLPAASFTTHSDLVIILDWVRALTGKIAAAETMLVTAEKNLISDSPPETRGRLLVLRAFIALLICQEYVSVVVLTQEALEILALHFTFARLLIVQERWDEA